MMNNEEKAAGIRKIVTIENKDDVKLLQEVLEASGGSIIKELPLISGFLCEFPQDNSVSLAARNLPQNIKIEEDLDFKLCCLSGFPFNFPNPFPPNQGFSSNPSKPTMPKYPAKPQYPDQVGGNVDWGIRRIGAPQVWSMLNSNRRVRVGIIDTGIDYQHPDLKNNFREGISTLDNHPTFYDDYGHGTHVAGTIGANSRQGMSGINPLVDFYVVKAFNKKGNGKLSDIIEGIDWLMRRQVNIINMSFSTSETNQIFERVMSLAYQQGIILVAAAGNDGPNSPVDYPARFPNVLAVSAIDSNDRLANFSCTGPEIDFCAPGVDINSTWLEGGYAVKSGTSFAAPHIAGTIADIINYYGPMHPYQIRSLMAQRAVALQALTREQQGNGLVEIPSLFS